MPPATTASPPAPPLAPSTPTWTYVSSPPTNFYSAEISGCQRLPNGNTLICEGIKGNLFEVTADRANRLALSLPGDHHDPDPGRQHPRGPGPHGPVS